MDQQKSGNKNVKTSNCRKNRNKAWKKQKNKTNQCRKNTKQLKKHGMDQEMVCDSELNQQCCH